MTRKYDLEMWELDHLLDSTVYEEQARCVDFVEEQVVAFDENHNTDFEVRFLPLIRVSFLLACVAQVEHHLKKICDVVAKRRNLEIRQTDLKGANGFESCVHYLRKVLQVPLPESKLKITWAIVTLRNAWVHQGGYLDAVPQNLGPLMKHVERTPDGQIELADEQFFMESSAICRRFVESVVDAIRAQSPRGTRTKKG